MDLLSERPRRLGSPYVIAVTGGAPVQLTSGILKHGGRFGAPDSKQIAFDANSEEHPGDRHLYLVSV